MSVKIKARGIILKDDKIFLVEDARCNKFMLPWGTLDEGESIVEALKREIFEELWVNPIIDKMWYVREFSTYDKLKWIDFCFFIKNIWDFENIDKTKCSHSDEWYSAKFHNLDDLDKMDNLYPKNLKELVLESLKNNKVYLCDL